LEVALVTGQVTTFNQSLRAKTQADSPFYQKDKIAEKFDADMTKE
jgi:hypothetical protein